MKNIGSLVLIACLCVFVSGADAFVFWDGSGGGVMQDGTAATFDWMNGGSDNGYFGTPTLAGDTFIFTPEAFRAESADGVSGTKADRLEVDLMAHMGQQITGIKITEYGDYGIVGTGEVQVSGGLFMTNMDAFEVADAELVSNPLSPITSGSGNWTATAEITGLDWTNVKFVLDNNLLAITGIGSTSFIQKKVVGTAIAIEFIPEPATLAILGFGALLLRRKK